MPQPFRTLERGSELGGHGGLKLTDIVDIYVSCTWSG